MRLDWQRVVLVCGDCERRSNGPQRLHSKELRRKLKAALRGPGAPRVVITACLGSCQKKGLTVVAMAPGAVPRALALRHSDELAAVALEWADLAGRAAPSPSPSPSH